MLFFFPPACKENYIPKRCNFRQGEKEGNEDLCLHPLQDHIADGCPYLMKKMTKADGESVLF